MISSIAVDSFLNCAASVTLAQAVLLPVYVLAAWLLGRKHSSGREALRSAAGHFARTNLPALAAVLLIAAILDRAAPIQGQMVRNAGTKAALIMLVAAAAVCAVGSGLSIRASKGREPGQLAHRNALLLTNALLFGSFLLNFLLVWSQDTILD
ncbi:MAG: hypothetical protein HZC36_08615 [Armatimonadetes bacterium]|nr:hypothetical protein [Armatimonadota bacterium]